MFSMFKDDAAMIRFDTDEGAGAADPSDAEEEEEDPSEEEDPEEEEEEEEAEPAKGDKKQHAPPEGSKRFKKIYAGHKMAQKYAPLGTPEEIARGQARLEELEKKQVAAAEEGEPLSKEAKAKRATIRKQMREIEPNLEKLEKQVAFQSEVQESLKVRSADAIIEIMEEHGFEVDEENFNAMAGAVQGVMARDNRLYLIWITNPEKAVKIAYKTFAETFQQEGTRKKNAALLKGKKGLKGLPKTIKATQGGPGGPAKQGKEAQTIKEAEDMFKEGWKQATQ